MSGSFNAEKENESNGRFVSRVWQVGHSFLINYTKHRLLRWERKESEQKNEAEEAVNVKFSRAASAFRRLAWLSNVHGCKTIRWPNYKMPRDRRRLACNTKWMSGTVLSSSFLSLFFHCTSSLEEEVDEDSLDSRSGLIYRKPFHSSGPGCLGSVVHYVWKG